MAGAGGRLRKPSADLFQEDVCGVTHFPKARETGKWLLQLAY